MLDDNSRIEVIVINSRPTLISLINLYMPSSRSRGDLISSYNRNNRIFLRVILRGDIYKHVLSTL
jgi:hypothetical protein